MKKKISKIETFTPSVDKSSFQTEGELPTTEQANDTVRELTGQMDLAIRQLKIAVLDKPIAPNKRKRETAKGTVLQAVMIEKELLKKVKLKAVHNEISFSEVINDALKQYFQ